MPRKTDKLDLWKRRLKANDTAYSAEETRMDGREAL